MIDPRRLALGTAQFGLSYGLANRTGQIASPEATRILARARQAGMATIDTAVAYGESEARLGAAGVSHWQIVSKLPPVPPAVTRVNEWVRQSVAGSLTRLRVPRLRGLLLHSPGQLLEPRGAELYAALMSLQEAGLTEQIGVSIYTPEELDTLVPRFRFDLVQAPLNILDRRLVDSGWLQRLADLGIEVHARSVFLQGLLLMDPVDRPAGFQRWNALWTRWDRWLGEQSATALQACLSFAGAHPGIARVVVGVDGLQHLEEILAAAAASCPKAPAALACEDRDLLDPSRWQAA